MKVSGILTFLLVAISKANAHHSFETYRTASAVDDGMGPIWNLVGNVISLAANAVDVLLPLENNDKCLILNALYKGALLKFPDLSTILSPRMVNVLDSCSTRDIKVSDSFSQVLIFPGTNWCGRDNIARNYHDLGVFNGTDSCCRDHDHCGDVIQSGKTKHNLFNPYKTSRFHCKCDEAFRHCLKKVNEKVSSSIVGYIFFNLLQTQCFDFESPAQCVTWNKGAVKLYCVEYEFQDDQPKKWQWFDKDPYF